MEKMDELEDGEISDSGNEMDLKGEASYRDSCVKQKAAKLKVPGLSSDESGGDSSDDENIPVKKQFSSSKPNHKNEEFINPLRAAKDSGFSCDKNYWLEGAYQSASKAKGKRVNNIWGSVLAEESLTTDIRGLQNEEQDYERTLGVESYDYRRAQFDTRPYMEEEEELDEDQDDESEDGDLLNKESFGTDKERRRKSAKDRLGKRPTDTEEDNSERVSAKDRLGHISDGEVDRKSVKERLGSVHDENSSSNDEQKTGSLHRNSPVDPAMETTNAVAGDVVKAIEIHNSLQGNKGSGVYVDRRKENRKRHWQNEGKNRHGRGKKDELIQHVPMKHVDIDPQQPEEVIVDDIISSLGEPEEQKIVFSRLIKLCGVDKVMTLLRATEDVEEMGGLTIHNGSRRRTPGGVFFFLLKNDKDITKEIMDEVFQENREKYKAELKREKKARRQKHRERAQREKAKLEAEGGLDFRDELTKYLEQKKQELKEKEKNQNVNVQNKLDKDMEIKSENSDAKGDSMEVKTENGDSHMDAGGDVIPPDRMKLDNHEEDDLFDSYAENIELDFTV